MSCHLYADAIGDLARDVVIHTDLAAAARAHLNECAACRALFARERTLTAGLRALAASSAGARPSAAVQARVMEAYAAHDALDAIDPRPPRNPRLRNPRLRVPRGPGLRNPRRPLAAAAILVLAVGLGWWWRPSPEPAPAGEPASAIVAHTPAPKAETPAVSRPVASPSRPRPARNRRPPARARVEEFMPVPGAAALPDLESGRIVRVELPLTALPAYGVDIAPDALRSEVAADLLVGQDGYTRAIRLVQRP